MRASSVLAVLLLLLSVGAASAQVAVRVPDTTRLQVAETTRVPVTVEGLVGEDVFSWQFTLRYDPAVLDTVRVHTSGTLADGRRVVVNQQEAGRLQGAVAGTTPLTPGGLLLSLEVRGRAAGTSALAWTAFQFNEGRPPAETHNGRMIVRVGDSTETVADTSRADSEQGDL